MASKNLPVNIDSTYTDNPDDASVALHQQYHDDEHELINLFDYDLMVAGAAGDFLAKDGGTGLWAPTAAPTGGGGGTGLSESLLGVIAIDDETGTDDARFTTTLTAANTATYPPVVQFGARNYTMSTLTRGFFTGLRARGSGGYSNPERNSGTKTGTRISLSGTGNWFEHTGGDVFSVTFEDLSLTGGSAVTAWGRNASATGTLYCMSMSGIFTSGLRSVIGTQTNKILMTAASFKGDWEINNSYNGAFHLGGSDNVFWADGMLLDSGTAFNTAGSANGQYHLWFDFMEKSYIGPLYVTCEGPWNGVRVTGPSAPATSGGSNLGGPLNFFGLRLEGRNAGAECNGACFRIEGGSAILRDSWVSYGMGSPSTPGHSPTDAGVIHQEGGILVVSGCTYDAATGISKTTVPWIYCGGGELMVNHAMRGSKGGTWSTTRPWVQDGAGTVLVSDASVDVHT